MPKVLTTLSFDEALKQFDAALKKQLATTKKMPIEVVRTAFRGVMRRVFTFTPPMSNKAPSFMEGRKAGQIQIQKDMKKMFRPIPKKYRDWTSTKKGRQGLINFFGPDAIPGKLNAGIDYFVKLHKANRGLNKRIVGKPRVPIWESTYKNVFTELVKWQGWVPSGWMKGAQEAGVNPPAWVSGKAGPGSMVKTLTDAKAIFKVINDTKHEDYNRIQFNINYAIIQQANAMNRAFADYLKKMKLG